MFKYFYGSDHQGKVNYPLNGTADFSVDFLKHNLTRISRSFIIWKTSFLYLVSPDKQ